MVRSIVNAVLVATVGFALLACECANAFANVNVAINRAATTRIISSSRSLRMSDSISAGSSSPQERIQALVNDYPVLLFMKGSRLFPQCGFSNTAVQILESFGIDFHTVDVLSDEAIRSGVKEFSQWPTIPQLYVTGEFIGGSDIMIELYQSGELGEMIEKAKADMI
jgi:monothiol glutaredoxin